MQDADKLQKVVAMFTAVSHEDQKAFLYIMERLADAPQEASQAELARVILDAAHETGNPKMVRVAEMQVERAEQG